MAASTNSGSPQAFAIVVHPNPRICNRVLQVHLPSGAVETLDVSACCDCVGDSDSTGGLSFVLLGDGAVAASAKLDVASLLAVQPPTPAKGAIALKGDHGEVVETLEYELTSAAPRAALPVVPSSLTSIVVPPKTTRPPSGVVSLRVVKAIIYTTSETLPSTYVVCSSSVSKPFHTVTVPSTRMPTFHHSAQFAVARDAAITLVSLMCITADGDQLVGQAEFTPFGFVDEGAHWFPMHFNGQLAAHLLLSWRTAWGTRQQHAAHTAPPASRLWSHVTVEVVGASGLKGAELGGSCDAMCVVQSLPMRDNEFQTTRVIRNSCNPQWKQTFDVVLRPRETAGLAFTVVDDDQVGGHTLLGTCTIKADSALWMAEQGEAGLPLTLREDRPEQQQTSAGSLHVRWKFSEEASNAVPKGVSPALTMTALQQYVKEGWILRLTKIRALDLPPVLRSKRLTCKVAVGSTRIAMCELNDQATSDSTVTYTVKESHELRLSICLIEGQQFWGCAVVDIGAATKLSGSTTAALLGDGSVIGEGFVSPDVLQSVPSLGSITFSWELFEGQQSKPRIWGPANTTSAVKFRIIQGRSLPCNAEQKLHVHVASEPANELFETSASPSTRGPNPSFGDEFSFRGYPQVPVITVALMGDHNEIFGSAKIDTGTLPSRQGREWVRLERSSESIGLLEVGWSHDFAQLASPPAATNEPTAQLLVTVTQARNLTLPASPSHVVYVIVGCGPHCKATKDVADSANPAFGESFQFAVPRDLLVLGSLRFQVMERTTGALVGAATMPLEETCSPSPDGTQKWVALSSLAPMGEAMQSVRGELCVTTQLLEVPTIRDRNAVVSRSPPLPDAVGLSLHVIRATNLAPFYTARLPSPKLLIQWCDHSFATKVVPNAKSPFWDEAFLLVLPSKRLVDPVKCYVYDSVDNAFLGSCDWAVKPTDKCVLQLTSVDEKGHISPILSKYAKDLGSIELGCTPLAAKDVAEQSHQLQSEYPLLLDATISVVMLKGLPSSFNQPVSVKLSCIACNDADGNFLEKTYVSKAASKATMYTLGGEPFQILAANPTELSVELLADQAAGLKGKTILRSPSFDPLENELWVGIGNGNGVSASALLAVQLKPHRGEIVDSKASQCALNVILRETANLQVPGSVKEVSVDVSIGATARSAFATIPADRIVRFGKTLSFEFALQPESIALEFTLKSCGSNPLILGRGKLTVASSVLKRELTRWISFEGPQGANVGQLQVQLHIPQASAEKSKQRLTIQAMKIRSTSKDSIVAPRLDFAIGSAKHSVVSSTLAYPFWLFEPIEVDSGSCTVSLTLASCPSPNLSVVLGASKPLAVSPGEGDAWCRIYATSGDNDYATPHEVLIRWTSAKEGKAALEYDLTVRVPEAVSLIPADDDGLSDPYSVVVFYGDQGPVRECSECIEDTLNPKWSHGTFTFRLRPTAGRIFGLLKVAIFDKDEEDEDDFLGEATINLAEDDLHGNRWMELAPRSDVPEDAQLVAKFGSLGQVHIEWELTTHKRRKGEDEAGGRRGEDLSSSASTCAVEVIRGRNLPAVPSMLSEGCVSVMSPPSVFVTVKIDSSAEQATKEVAASCNPLFPKPQNLLSFPLDDGRSAQIIATAWHKNELGSGRTFLGQVVTDLHTLIGLKGPSWFPLQPRPGNKKDLLRGVRAGFGEIELSASVKKRATAPAVSDTSMWTIAWTVKQVSHTSRHSRPVALRISCSPQETQTEFSDSGFVWGCRLLTVGPIHPTEATRITYSLIEQGVDTPLAECTQALKEFESIGQSEVSLVDKESRPLSRILFSYVVTGWSRLNRPKPEASNSGATSPRVRFNLAGTAPSVSRAPNERPPLLMIREIAVARPSDEPTPTLGHTAVDIQGKIVVCGGVNSNGFEPVLRELTPDQRRWRFLRTSRPIVREGHSVVCRENVGGLSQIVVYGGFGPGGLDREMTAVSGRYESVSTVYQIGSIEQLSGGSTLAAGVDAAPGYLDSTLTVDGKTHEIRMLPTTGPAKDFRAEHSAVLFETSKMFVYGGWSITIVESVRSAPLAQEPQGSLLTTQPPQPSTMTLLEASWTADPSARKTKVSYGTTEYVRGDVACLDIDTGFWSLVAATPSSPDGSPRPRYGHTAVAHHNTMIVFGGCEQSGEAGLPHPSNELFSFDVSTCSWRKLGPLANHTVWPRARSGHCAVVYKDTMILVGGRLAEPNKPDSAWQYIFETQTWRKIGTAVGAGVLRPRFRAAAVITSSVIGGMVDHEELKLFVIGGSTSGAMAMLGCESADRRDVMEPEVSSGTTIVLSITAILEYAQLSDSALPSASGVPAQPFPPGTPPRSNSRSPPRTTRSAIMRVEARRRKEQEQQSEIASQSIIGSQHVSREQVGKTVERLLQPSWRFNEMRTAIERQQAALTEGSRLTLPQSQIDDRIHELYEKDLKRRKYNQNELKTRLERDFQRRHPINTDKKRPKSAGVRASEEKQRQESTKASMEWIAKHDDRRSVKPLP